MLWRALGHLGKGFYIDVGANDPFYDSVTQLFYDKGWHGINIEPVPGHYAALKEYRPEDINLQCAAADTDGSFTLYEIEGVRGWATLDAGMAQTYRNKGHNIIEIVVSVKTLTEICSQYVDGDIHFLKVDVEGAEEKVFRGMDLKRWRPWIIIAESRVPTEEGVLTAAWETLVTGKGYSQVYFDGVNTFYLADERREQLQDAFTSPPNDLDGYVRYNEWRCVHQGSQREALLRDLDHHVRHLGDALRKAQAQLDEKSNQLAQAEQTLACIYASRSWRITAPLRAAVRKTPRSLVDVCAAPVRLARRLKNAKAGGIPEAPPNPHPVNPSSVLPDSVRGSMHGDSLEIYDIISDSLKNRAELSGRGERPSLAFVSPMPPVKSGIADYSAELLPLLAKYYDITVITEARGQADSFTVAGVAARTLEWFTLNGDRFERILYHIGNSPHHAHVFPVIKRHPGVVMLHDVFLSDLLNYLASSAGCPEELPRAVYREQGFTPLSRMGDEGVKYLLSNCPCSLHVIALAAGVLVHSDFARNALIRSYGPSVATMLRKVPFMRNLFSLPDRSAARERLGISGDDFIVCSFGFIGYTKLSHRLLGAWAGSILERIQNVRLCFVGDNDKGPYGIELEKAIEQSGNGDRMSITGFIPPETYRDYLAAADIAVQLRENTRGETSAAVYDCLVAGLPVICNAHGSNAELPEEVAIKLPEHFDDLQLRHALESAFRNPENLKRYAVSGREYLAAHHRPEQAAEGYFNAIEHFAAESPRSRERRMWQSFPLEASTAERAAFARELAGMRPKTGLHQILVDISAIVQHDLKTGIQRVVRSILGELVNSPPFGYRAEPVYYNGNGGYSYARRFMLRNMGLDEGLLDDDPVQAADGDIFIGADLVFSVIPLVKGLLKEWHAKGVTISFIAYDMLPLQRPDCFPPDIEEEYLLWLKTVLRVSDKIVCISGAVAEELKTYTAVNSLESAPSLEITHFHLGADISASLPTTGIPEGMESVLHRISACQAFLMVGTIEPRKGHAQAIAAFDLLWEAGVEANLVIVGKPGWMTQELVERLDTHPENGKRLFCLYRISDEALEEVYKNVSCLLAPSEGEGFGLPLIEAAQHGLPLLVRGIPVFREVAGEFATYFEGNEPKDLADSICQWLGLDAGERTSSSGMPWLTWKQSTQRLLAELGVSGNSCP